MNKPSYKLQGRFRLISISTHQIYWLKQSFSNRNIHGSNFIIHGNNFINSITAQKQRYTYRDGATWSETLAFILSLTHTYNEWMKCSFWVARSSHNAGFSGWTLTVLYWSSSVFTFLSKVQGCLLPFLQHCLLLHKLTVSVSCVKITFFTQNYYLSKLEKFKKEWNRLFN